MQVKKFLHYKRYNITMNDEFVDPLLVNVVSKIINQLVDLKVIVPDTTIVKKGYRYQKIYEVFVGTNNY